MKNHSFHNAFTSELRFLLSWSIGDMNSKTKRKVAAYMILTAVILWLVALIFLIIIIKNVTSRATKKRRCTATTNAIIKDVKERFITLMTTEYIPIISYTVDGNEYTCKFTKAYVPDTYQVGQSIEIQYNPIKPKEINTKGESNKSDYVFLAITVVLGIIGYVFIRFF